MTVLKKSICFISGLALVAGCSLMPKGNKVELAEVPSIQVSHEKANILWETRHLKGNGANQKLKPLLTKQIIYAADYKGDILAQDRFSGEKIWQIATKKPLSVGPIFHEGQLVFGTLDGEVFAIDSKTTQKLWSQTVSSEVLSAPKIKQQLLVVHSIDGKLTAIDLRDGQLRWSVDRQTPALTLRGNSSPIIHKDKVITGFANGLVVALDINSGEQLWEARLSTPKGRSEIHRMVDIIADPKILGDTAYVISYQGRIGAIDLESGRLNWQRDVSSYFDLAVDRKAVYVTDQDHQLWALDRSSGRTLWKQDALKGRYITSPATSRKHILVGDKEGYLFWLSKDTGELKGKVMLGESIEQQPFVSQETSFVTMKDGRTTALRIEGSHS